MWHTVETEERTECRKILNKRCALLNKQKINKWLSSYLQIFTYGSSAHWEIIILKNKPIISQIEKEMS